MSKQEHLGGSCEYWYHYFDPSPPCNHFDDTCACIILDESSNYNSAIPLCIMFLYKDDVFHVH